MPINDLPGGFVSPGFDAGQIRAGRRNFIQVDGAHRNMTIGSITTPEAVIDPNIPFYINGSQNSYYGMNVFNFGVGGTVSADIVAVAPGTKGATGNISGTYMDMGINSNDWSDATYAVMDANGGYLYNSSGPVMIGAAGTGQLNFFTGPVSTKASIRMVIDNSGNIAMGTGPVGSAATDGFMYMRGGTGAPTGVPTAKAGMLPFYYDMVANKLYVANTGTWRAQAGTFV